MKDSVGALILQGLVGIMSLVALVPICALLYRMGRDRPRIMALSVAMGVVFIATFFFLRVK